MTMPRIRTVALPALAAVLVAVVALLVKSGAPAAPPATAAAAAEVRRGPVAGVVSDYAFTPDTLTVKVGTRIKWTNHDPTAHSATANGGAFDTGTINPHSSRTIRLTKPGVYPYHCVFHAFMTGTVTVVR